MICGLLSDLHYENHGKDAHVALPAVIDTLIFAGDVSNVSTLQYVLEHYCELGIHILFVPGNHDFYGRFAIEKLDKICDDLQRSYTNFHRLSHKSGVVNIDGVRFAGDTLWFPDDGKNYLYEGYMPDFRAINPGVGSTAVWINEQNMLATQLLTKVNADIVVTHHMPSLNLVQPPFIGSPINRFFVSDTFSKCQFRPKIWCYGHTHTFSDVIVGETRFLCNPRGYLNERGVRYSYNVKLFTI